MRHDRFGGFLRFVLFSLISEPESVKPTIHRMTVLVRSIVSNSWRKTKLEMETLLHGPKLFI